jgi:cellulose synthase/poly-beta-1,6-N-acetylglucosamine synthase-like glycosyltransferase
LRRIVAPFSEPKIGGVDGHLFFVINKKSGIATSQNCYWNYELRLRQLETKLGLLAVASGACMAIRKELFRKMDSAYGEDCIIPLDIVMQGYKMVHVSDAIAYDQQAPDSQRAFKNRVRMTLRNFQGTLSRKSILNPFRFPGYAFALWSHKIFRWLSPIFLIMLTVSSFLLMNASKGHVFTSISLTIFYIIGFGGWLADRYQWPLPVVKKVYSFLLANLGFLVGLFRAILGHRITRYK